MLVVKSFIIRKETNLCSCIRFQYAVVQDRDKFIMPDGSADIRYGLIFFGNPRSRSNRPSVPLTIGLEIVTLTFSLRRLICSQMEGKAERIGFILLDDWFSACFNRLGTDYNWTTALTSEINSFPFSSVTSTLAGWMYAWHEQDSYVQRHE